MTVNKWMVTGKIYGTLIVRYFDKEDLAKFYTQRLWERGASYITVHRLDSDTDRLVAYARRSRRAADLAMARFDVGGRQA